MDTVTAAQATHRPEGNPKMDDSANPAEVALQRARDHRADMARWLALVLMTDEIALQDDALQERLIDLQDKIEAQMRAAT